MLIDIYPRIATDPRVSLTGVGEQPAPQVPHAGRGPAVVGQARTAHGRRGRRAGPDRGIRLGVEEVRLTGGEPLLRPGLVGIVERCVALAFTPEKANAVLLPDLNDDEAPELLARAMENDYELRFVEQIPLDVQHGRRRDGMITAGDILESLSTRFTLAPEPDEFRGLRAHRTPARRRRPGPGRRHRLRHSPLRRARDRSRLTAGGRCAPACSRGRSPTCAGVALRGAGRGDRATTSTDRTRSEAMGRVTERRRVVRVRDGAVSARPDTLVAEEPLEIRLGGKPLAITMRTPGDDFALAAGFLVSEGVVSRADDVANIVYCAGATDDGSNTYNVVDVQLAPGVPLPDITLERNVYTTSSCGLCGKASLDAVRTTTRWPIADTPSVRVTPGLLAALPDQLRAAQRVFDRTGGLHAAGLFSPEGELLDLREDVGRHNAVDKLIGRALQSGRLPLSRSILLVSGRASFELAQKAVMAGIPVLAAVSAPSSLAVDLATETGLTLVGFLRGGSMNVYAGEQRLDLYAGAPEGGPAR